MAAKVSIKLKTVCLKIGSGATPRGGKEAYKGGDTALIRSQNIYNDGFRKDGIVYIDDTQASELKNVEVLNGDVLLNITGDSVARCCQVSADILPARVNQHVAIIRPDPKTLDARYLHYILVSNKYQEQLLSLSSAGATRPALTKLMIENLEVHLPHLAEQTRIAGILGALDDKIELNRKMNETLEQMAKTLFKSWFVDFDPVHAKAACRQPVGMDKATADLFPGSFVDSEMGKIPKGWEVADLGQIADITDCLHAKKPEASETGQLYLQLNNILDDGLIDISEAFLIGPEDYKKWTSRMEATEGDCVITNVGRVGAVAQIPQGMKAALGRNITGIRCKPIFTNPTFLIECLMSEAMREEIRKKTDTGTILDALNVKSIPKLRFIRPPSMIAERFERLARPLRHQMERGVSQSRTLANLRDTLLPKLLSGYPTKTSHK
jgi:type I restriction enzyme S subunit